MVKESVDLLELLRKQAGAGDLDFLREAVAVLAQAVTDAEVVRLVGAVLAAQHDEWAVARRYMAAVTLLPPPAREVTSGEEVLLQAAG